MIVGARGPDGVDDCRAASVQPYPVLFHHLPPLGYFRLDEFGEIFRGTAHRFESLLDLTARAPGNRAEAGNFLRPFRYDLPRGCRRSEETHPAADVETREPRFRCG